MAALDGEEPIAARSEAAKARRISATSMKAVAKGDTVVRGASAARDFRQVRAAAASEVALKGEDAMVGATGLEAAGQVNLAGLKADSAAAADGCSIPATLSWWC
jgi:hypothetical protein